MSVLNKIFSSNRKLNAQKSSAKKSNDTKEWRFVQSKSFRGFKRFHVSHYGYEPAEQGLKRLKKSCHDLSGAEIVLIPRKRSGTNFLDVNVNGFFIGSLPFWNGDEDEYLFMKKYLYKGKVDSAHVRIETTGLGDDAVHLFLHVVE